MYCINCGAKLADGEKQCPLCGTIPYHPELSQPEAERLYPMDQMPAVQLRPKGVQIILTAVVAVTMLMCLMIDLQINRTVVWSGYVLGALMLSYVVLFLPLWFRKPNPVVFVPCDFVAAGLYVLYIDLATGGHWFMSFAFPLVGIVGGIVTAVTVLLHYLRRGRLYVIGGALIAAGGFMPLIEFLLNVTIGREDMIGWFVYPLVGLVFLGGMLIFLEAYRPARENLERKFFV